MNNEFMLTCESTVDVPYSLMQERNIDVLFYTVLIDGKEVEDDMGRTKGHEKAFLDKLLNNHEISTCQINEYKYETFFQEQLKNTSSDILHICFGTGMTQSYNNALSAAEKLNQTNSKQKIYVVDSLCSCGGYGLFVDIAADMRDKGMSAKEVCNWCIAHRLKVRHEFYCTDLTFFKKSGRVSGPTATIATLLNICPVMRLNKEGKIISYNKVRGEKKAILHTLEQIKQYASNGINYSGKCIINHCDAQDSAKKLREEILNTFKNIKCVDIYPIGDVISSHCGPGTVSLFFFGQDRE